VANNKRYEFFNDAVANAIQDNADANPTNCDAPADIQVEIELADGTIESRIVEMIPDHAPRTRSWHTCQNNAKEFMSGTPVPVATTTQLHNMMECRRTDNPEAQQLCYQAIATECGTLDRRCVWSSRHYDPWERQCIACSSTCDLSFTPTARTTSAKQGRWSWATACATQETMD
jgi:hypothetical protein